MPEVESWDDDGDFQGDFFTQSSARTNISSRMSVKSESNMGDDDWHISLAPNDNNSTTQAINSANQVGIPIPKNVPSSALLGGSIKRLGKIKSKQNMADDWGDDFDFPMTGTSALKLRPSLASDALAPSTPATDQEEFDSEWAEGSLGIRFAGTRRDHRGRSSSVSAMSPSMGSCMTVESEDDELGGLLLPTEPIDFTGRLKKRQAAEYDPPTSVPTHAVQPVEAGRHAHERKKSTPHAEEDDMSAGLDFDGVDLVDPKRRKMNRNIKISQLQPKPLPTAARTTSTITFSDKPASSKIPRPSASSRNLKLDTVPESNSPQTQRSINRISRLPPTTTSSQLLRSKRSAPVLGTRQAPVTGRTPIPFLPAGTGTAQSHHVSAKSGSFHFRQPSDSHDRSQSPTHRSYSRMSGVQPTDTTPSRTGYRKDAATVSLLRKAASQRTLQVKKTKNYGDGSELDRFDDLPTSVSKESRFIKEPSARTQPKTLRSTQSRRNLISHDLSSTPVPPSNASNASTVPTTPLASQTPKAYFPKDNTPRFARDTAASRNAREQRLGGTLPRRGLGPIEAVAINWKAQVAARSPQTSPSATRHKKSGDVKKPILIKHMGPGSRKMDEGKGMIYNQALQKWEGNEHVLTKFENPSTSTLPLHPTHKDNHSHHHHTNSIPSTIALAPRDLNIPPRHGSPPRPALISQFSNARGVVVERGMVFDPQRMTWLKIDSRAIASDPMLVNAGFSPASISVEEEEDPFALIEDLVDEKTANVAPGAGAIRTASGKENTEWAVGEEFDLGPAFVRRQRAEEAEWRRRVEKWMHPRDADADTWRWEIRRVAESYEGLH